MRVRECMQSEVVTVTPDDTRRVITVGPVSSLAREERKVAILHLAAIDPRPAIRALEGTGYRVGWPSLEGDPRNLEARIR